MRLKITLFGAEMSSVCRSHHEEKDHSRCLKRFLIWMAMASIGICIARFCMMIVCLPSPVESFDPRVASIIFDAAKIFESMSDPGTLLR